MKSTLNQSSEVHSQLTIDIPAETVRIAFSDTYKDIQKKTTIKGFRKGKAPMSQIKTHYSAEIIEDVLDKLWRDSFPQALREYSLELASEPIINFEELIDNKEFSYTVKFENNPKVTVNKYINLKVKKEKLEIDESQVEALLYDVQERYAEFTPIFEDRPAQNGDTVEIDFNGIFNDAPLINSRAQDYHLELGSKSFISGFESGIEGMKINENRTLLLTFPKNYDDIDLAGQPVKFEITLKAIGKKSFPEINDDFVKKNIKGVHNLNAFIEILTTFLIRHEKERIHQDLLSRVVKQLVHENPIEVPPNLVARQKKVFIAYSNKELEEDGFSEQEIQEYEEEWDDNFTQSAERFVKSFFLLQHLVNKLEFYATEDEITAKIKEVDQEEKAGLKKIEEYCNTDRRSYIGSMIAEDKLVHYLAEQADITEVTEDQLDEEDDEDFF